MAEMINLESSDTAKDNIEKLKDIFPDIVKDGKIDFDTLKLILGDEIETDSESYKFEWVGKKNCYKSIQTPSNGTLKYVKEDSLNPDTSENLIIEGDNFEVLKLFQSSYKNSIKMIYIDPPYNTGNDFVYPDNFKTPLENYLEITGQKVGDEITQSKKSKEGRKHTQWLNMLFPRLLLSRTLLKDDGVIFISIDDNEIENLKRLCDEVFGEENFISQLAVINNIAGRSDKKHIATAHEYVLIYQKSDKFTSTGLPLTEEQLKDYKFTDKKTGKLYRKQGLRKRGSGARRIDRPNMFYPIYYDEKTDKVSLDKNKFKNPIEITPKLSNGSDGRWRWGKKTFTDNIDFLEVKKNNKGEYDIDEKVFLETDDGEKSTKMKSYLLDSDYTTDTATSELTELMGEKVFDTPKPVQLIKDFLKIVNDNDCLVLDFFAGSGTTGQAVLEQNQLDGGSRKFILVQLPEKMEHPKYSNINDVVEERAKRVIEGYGDNPEPLNDGFKVFKLDNSNYKVNEAINVNKDSDKDEIIKKLRQQFKTSTVYDESMVDGYAELDVIYENILKEGYSLNSHIEVIEDIIECKIYKITDNVKKSKVFYITFDKVDTKIAAHKEFAGISNDTLLICFDNNLSDSDKQNLSKTFRLKTM